MTPRIEPLGDEALRVALPDGVDRAGALSRLRGIAGVVDVTMAEAHAAILFAGAPPASAVIEAALRGGAVGGAAPREVTLVARYDGPDLARVAAWAHCSVTEVVERHVGRVYTARYLGFLPGFAYLGDVDPRIAAPRLPAPRARVEAGHVGIAGARTGVYPAASPGGWNLVAFVEDFIGWTPDAGPLLRPGDRVRFVPR